MNDTNTNTYTYERTVYRIRHKNRGHFGIYEGNDKIGTFEFHTEDNARKFIKEKQLADVTIDEITVTTTETIKNL